jgi:hypothetical protein
MPDVQQISFGAATFLLPPSGTDPTEIRFRLPALRMALVDREQRLSDVDWGKPGIYFLFGPGDAPGQVRVYTGKSLNVARRLIDHYSVKDWWDRALVVIQNGDGFTPSDVEWLEAYFVDSLRRNTGGQVTNRATPKSETLPVYQQQELAVIAQPVDAVLRLLGVISFSTEPEIEEDPGEDLPPSKPRAQMPWLDAACQVLLPDEELHADEIVKRIGDRGLRDLSGGKTPGASMRRELRRNSLGPTPRVRQTAPSTFALL